MTLVVALLAVGDREAGWVSSSCGLIEAVMPAVRV